MRRFHRLVFVIIVTVSIIGLLFSLLSSKLAMGIENTNRINDKHATPNQSIDVYTRCLLDMDQALDSLAIPSFLTFGTALMYWRGKNFISDDIDVGIFYKDFETSNYSETNFLSIMKKFHFALSHTYGQMDHGKEWTFLCPKSRINIDIFVYYPINERNSLYAYWTATYNGLCDEMIYGKCRWGFSKFNLTTFQMFGKTFNIVPLEFIIERYGHDYMIPKKYDYFKSLKILPNLILEYKDSKKNIIPRPEKI